MNIFYTIEVNHQILDLWLSLSDTDDDSIRRLLIKSLEKDKNLFRFVVRTDTQVIARFSVELQANSLVIWWPTISKEVQETQWILIFEHILKYIEIFGEEKEKKFIELKIRQTNLLQSLWTKYLLSQGFNVLSYKHEYQLNPFQNQLCLEKSSRLYNGTRLISYGPYFNYSNRIESIYQETVKGSMDRSDLYECEMEVPLGQVDHLFIIAMKTNEIGLLACLSEPQQHSGWIKYIGIVPTYRRRGYGTYLLCEAISWATNQGIVLLRSLIDQKNLASLATHQLAGFSRQDEIKTIACLYKSL